MDSIDEQLEIQLCSELELPRVKSRRRLAEVSAASIAFAKGIDDRIERICRRFVKSIEEVKYLADQIEAYAVAKSDLSRNAHIDRKERVGDPHITAEIAVGRENAGKAVCVDRGLAKRTVRTNRRSFVGALKIAVRVAGSNDVERTA